MKINYKYLLRSILCVMVGVSLASCEDYLDKEPASTLNETEAFKNFMNFQGYIEEIYNCIPDKANCNWSPTWNWGDEMLQPPNGNGEMAHQVDIGNFRNWSSGNNWLYNNRPPNQDTQDRVCFGLWSHGWYCIRKANLGIDNLHRFVGTDEEKRLIEGQLYFFRAWWHFEMMQFWGGLPYIDQTLDASVQLTLPVNTYNECADKAAADFRRAADLLPVDWESTAPGKNTPGKNQIRINKIMALGYLGKNYLWAASPLMKNGAQLGARTSGKTYDYDTAYAQKAADAFGELLKLIDEGTQYSLVGFDYSNIYDHVATSGTFGDSYSNIFYTQRQNGITPGATEAIFRGPKSAKFDASGNNLGQSFTPKALSGTYAGPVQHPTANAVNMYGMANGLPLDHPDSGFDPNYPFKDRDPRFYHDIVFDGILYVAAPPSASITEEMRYATLHNSGTYRDVTQGSQTGYLIQKIAPHSCNAGDNGYSWSAALVIYIPYMRLSDIYLMYAEACAAVNGANGTATNYTMTAKDALNVVRARVGAGEVHAHYTGDAKLFMDEVRRERAVELMFEGFRFNDLQRWLLLTEAPYNQKTTQLYDRTETAEWFTKNDPKDAKVANWGEEVILTRHFGTKHYWFPFPDDDVYLYAEFPQNPGW